MQFTVTNTGNITDTYTFTCVVTGGVTCANVNPSSVTLISFGQQVVTVTYSVGSTGGQLTLDALGDCDVGSCHDTGYRLVTTPPVITLVVPKVTNGADTALVRSRSPRVLATYSADAPIDTTSFVLKLGSDTVSKLARRNAALAEWKVDEGHQLSPGVTQSVYVRVCHVNSGCTSVTHQVLLDNSGPPILSFAGMPLEVHGSTAEVETGFSIPPYFSMNAARSTGLTFSTRQSYPVHW